MSGVLVSASHSYRLFVLFGLARLYAVPKCAIPKEHAKNERLSPRGCGALGEAPTFMLPIEVSMPLCDASIWLADDVPTLKLSER